MNNISNRLKSIALFINPNDKVVDVGCDHGLLSIYLHENKLCKSVVASDINENALSNAKKNIKESGHKIKTFVSDGVENVPTKLFDTIVISGMGTSTMLHILNSDNVKDVNKIVLQSNNDHELLRKSMNDMGFYLENEITIYENKKYYITMLFIRNNITNSKEVLEYGILNADKIDYYSYLVNSNKKILKKLPFCKFKLRFDLYKSNYTLNNLIKKIKKVIS